MIYVAFAKEKIVPLGNHKPLKSEKTHFSFPIVCHTLMGAKHHRFRIQLRSAFCYGLKKQH